MLIGRLASGDAGLPPRGKIVQPEYLTPTGFRSVINAARTDSRGRFRIPYTFQNKPVKPTPVTFRIFVPDDGGGWSFIDGYSRERTVIVLP